MANDVTLRRLNHGRYKTVPLRRFSSSCDYPRISSLILQYKWIQSLPSTIVSLYTEPRRRRRGSFHSFHSYRIQAGNSSLSVCCFFFFQSESTGSCGHLVMSTLIGETIEEAHARKTNVMGAKVRAAVKGKRKEAAECRGNSETMCAATRS